MYRQHQHDAAAGAEQQYQLSANNSFNYSGFSGSMGPPMMDQTFQNNPQHLSPSIRPAIPRQQPHARQSSNEWHGPSRQPSNSLSPRFSNVTPASVAPITFTPADRTLPSLDVNADTIADAYVPFILYCNPNFALDVDTATLRANFQSPPKSDNKDFEVYRLFELIRKFDAKEIKTWGQLALDLGVEAPDVSKGQSVQKVQQYSVRLKRWMRAMHVDAYFEYLLGKQHPYFTEIPHPSDPYPSGGRDGVLVEEDLAIRALDPSFRPKRGRRRNSEVEQEEGSEYGAANAQSQTFDDTSQGMPASAHPMSVMQFNPESGIQHDPWAAASAVTPQSFAPWMQRAGVPQTAVATTAPSYLRWQLHGNSQNPATPHPMTALPTSMTAHIAAAFDGEPKSAVTPSSRKRRKHGPAVSSAWPSGNNSGGKQRGRPPASRNVQDGPFSTFPADPANNKLGGSSFLTPMSAVDNKSASEIEQSIPPIATAVMQSSGETAARPSKLSLQVPQHTGGPVRLATPPRVMVTSETSESERQPSIETEAQELSTQRITQRVEYEPLPQHIEYEPPGFTFEALKRVLASDLLRAELVGRRNRLNGDEAKRLAEAVLDRLNIPRADTSNLRDDVARLTAASWLGIGGQLNVPLGPATGQNKRVTITRFREDAQGYEEIVSAREDFYGQTRDVFDLSWTVSMGGCNGSFELKGLSITNAAVEQEDTHDSILRTWQETSKQLGMSEEWIRARRKDFSNPKFGANDMTLNLAGAIDGDNVDWKARYQALVFGTKMAKGEFNRFRQHLIDRVLDVVI